MEFIVLIMCLLCGLITTVVMGATPAFPGAEGYGKWAQGGRGGEVFFVTNLNDKGPGSLRAACEAEGPRTVIFRTGGTITLKTPLRITHPYLTIAGQTAPGGGICLTTERWRGSTEAMLITTHDIILRHLRVRPAPYADLPEELPPTRHGAAHEYTWVAGINLGGAGAHDIILDHISASWGSKHQIGAWGGASNITLQHCILAEGIRPEPMHKGGLFGGGSDKITIYRCLFASNADRNPYIKASDDLPAQTCTRAEATFQLVNNVVYNYGSRGALIGAADSAFWAPAPGRTKANLIGNYYKPGPSTNLASYEIQVAKAGYVQIYLQDNFGPHRPGPTNDEWDLVGLQWLGTDSFAPTGTPAPKQLFQALAPFDTPPLPINSAQDAYSQVLREVGAIVPLRDPVDERIISEVIEGAGKIIDDPAEVGGWPSLAEGTPYLDENNDGIDDRWELKEYGTLVQHGHDDSDNDGYTALERFLNSKELLP